jgi:hypothetical protein
MNKNIDKMTLSEVVAEPEVGKKKDADLAMAWKYGLEKSVYQSIELES